MAGYPAEISFDALKGKIRSTALREIAAHWDSARGQHRFPLWSRFTQDNLASYADKIWAFDFNRSSGEITARFGGKTARFGFGHSFLGTPLRNLHPPHVFEVSQAIFTRVISEPACCRWSGKLFRADDDVIEGERIMMPVGSNQEHVDGLLGASDFDCLLPRTPRNLEIIHDIADWCRL
jgi:hypothetical protein